LLAQVKNKLALNLLFTANGISGFAQGISMLAIPWYFANNTPYFNKAYGLITIGVLFFGLYAGTLVDKYSRKANFLGNSLVCGFLLLAIAGVGFYQNGLNDVLVVAVFGITMLNYNIHYPTLYAFGQEISSVEDYAKVNSNIEIVGQSTSILSGGIAAVMLEGVTINLPIINYAIVINSWNIWEIFLLNAGTYFLAASLILFIKYQPKQIV
jgi:MFS family permease